MNHKRNRTIDEKIEDCLQKIGNLHPKLKEEMKKLLLSTNNIFNSVVKSKSFLSKKYSLPESGKQSKIYWTSRGWSNIEATLKSEPYRKKINHKSVYSREYWIEKINPKTSKKYTLEEADFERNSRRPIRKEYWIVRGYSENEALQLALEKKDQNNKKGKKVSSSRSKHEMKTSSKRCKEYWIVRGYSENEAKEKISKLQSTFSLEKCIEKHGKIKGKILWKNRQEKWQNTLNSKPKHEIERINRARMFNGKGYSNISQELFNELYSIFEDKIVYYATLNMRDNGLHNEYFYKSKTTNKKFFFDFYYPKKKKIIEFDGDYWHGKTSIKKRDRIRQDILEKEGFSILRIKERDYLNDKQKAINECLTFLKQ